MAPNVPSLINSYWITSPITFLPFFSLLSWYILSLFSGCAKVGGWATEYGSLLTFATVRGAAHMVPYSQPERALLLFKSFVSGRSLPNTTHPSSDWKALNLSPASTVAGCFTFFNFKNTSKSYCFWNKKTLIKCFLLHQEKCTDLRLGILE